MCFTPAIHYLRAPDALERAFAYVQGRRKDLAQLQAELTFKFDGTGMLVTEIYGNHIAVHVSARASVADYRDLSGPHAGSGRIHIVDDRGAFAFKDIAQPLAYILARWW